LKSLTERKKAELKLIAEMTLEATLAAEEKLSKLAGRKTAPRSWRFTITEPLTNLISTLDLGTSKVAEKIRIISPANLVFPSLIERFGI